MDIYDRAAWPKPESNPLVQLLLSGDEWFTNEQIVTALGLSRNRALLSEGTIFKRQIDDGDAGTVSRGWLTPGKKVTRSNGGTMRVFNRRALVIAAMRTDTLHAAAFRDWMATKLAEELVPPEQRAGAITFG